MYKEHLVSPGPTAVPPDALLAMAKPIYHHRTKRFDALFGEVSQKLKTIFSTTRDVFTLTSSGSGAMEAAVVNTINAGDKVITINGGKFGERWAKINKKYGAIVDEIVVPWGKSVDPMAVDAKLKADPSVVAVFVQHCETSTGAMHDVKALAAVTAKYNAILVVDAITALGVHECAMDAWGIDILLSGSQKALMIPPGLALIALSDKAWKRVEQCKTPVFYFDLRAAKKELEKKTTPWTPALTLVIGLNSVIDMMIAEGLPNVYARHANIAAATRKGCEALGLKVFPENPANGVTAALAPKGLSGKKIKSVMEEKYKVSIAGSQDVEKADIIRIGHIGYYDKSDIVLTLSSLEFALKDLGHSFTWGASLAAAQEVLYTGAPKV
ncbi:MAG: alanine--glyoxylate aminotransferase family protein [Spirochaetes bacterium]|nr:alanine--glyoxylate aminotransferase family protein [Spirochaetota bacterium]